MNTLRYLSAVVFGFVSLAFGEITVATPPVGYEKLEARGLSDTYFGLPLVKRPVLTARVTDVAANTITVSAGVGLDELVASLDEQKYYVQFVTGKLSGLCLRIVGGDATTLTLDTEGEDLTAHTLGLIETGDHGDLVRVRSAWRLAEIFGDAPATLKLDAIPHLSGGPYIDGDAVLISTTLVQESLVYYVFDDGWRSVADPSADAGKISFLPGTVLGVRRHAPAAAEILVIGDVPTEPLRLQIPASSAQTESEIAISLAHPVSRPLAEVGLFSVASEESILAPALSVLDGGDFLFEWDSARVGMALPSKSRFHVIGTNWYDVAAPADEHLLQPGRGYVLRLRAGHGRRYWLQPAWE